MTEDLTQYNCPDCKGTGRDAAKTKEARLIDGEHIRCWSCNGNGLDPAAFFTWRKSPVRTEE